MNEHDPIDLPGQWEDEDARPRRRRGRRAALIGLFVALSLVVVGGVVAGSYLWGLNDSYQQRTTVSLDRGSDGGESGGEATHEGGRNFLLLGSDARNAEGAEESGNSGQRSDVMMLVHVPQEGTGIYITSFPRDLWVDIPGHGEGRINAAFAHGGVPLAVATVENYTGVPIEHVAMIDFDGVEGLVDTLGGVDVEVTEDFESGGHQFAAGTQRLDGEQALAFVRERKQFAEGDFQRNRNQQALLKGIAETFLSRDTLTNPTRLADAVETVSPYLTTDDQLTTSAMMQLGLSLRDNRTGDLHFLSVPHGGPTTTSGGASVVATDEEEMDVLREALKNDDMGTYFSQYAGRY